MWRRTGIDEDIVRRLERIECKLNRIITEENEIMNDLTALTAQVAAQTTVETSAITLIQGLAAQIKAASGNQAAIDALTSQLQTSASALAAAITANTPVAPVVTPPAAV